MNFSLRVPEIILGDFMLPWGMVIGALGFFAAWLIVGVLERLRLTRYIWNLPLFFLALAVLCGCSLGLLFAP
jgi:ribose/xylose/arabinose/galactoside ABC-type transport system permease subunit